MNEYMLVTYDPLYSSKSFHKTWESIKDRIDEVVSLTEKYYELQGKEFLPEVNYLSGEYPGILIYKIWPDKPHALKLVGKTKLYKQPEELNGLDSSVG